MAALTSVNTPVHIVDIDRKVKAMSMFQNALRAGSLTYKEIGDTISEDGLAKRLDALINDAKPARAPRGWSNFANYCGSLESDPAAKAAGTICIDSYTQLALHARAHIQFLKGKSKFVWDDWSTWKAIWTETTTILIDYCLDQKKDLVVILHERVSEKPGNQTGRVIVQQKPSEKGGVVTTREYQGTMDVRIAGSIEGAFGLEFGSYFTDVYALHVDIVSGKPVWKCRVLPDGQRDLRCSFDVKGVADWDPDFRKIQKGA